MPNTLMHAASPPCSPLHNAQQHLPNVSLQRIGTAAQKNAYWLMPVLVDNPEYDPANVVLQLRKLRHGCHAGRNVHARVWHSRAMPQRAPHHAARGVFTNEIMPVE
ncbi:MAG: hypothetical protein V9E91_08730 [Burkholderiaceae bacterium]